MLEKGLSENEVLVVKFVELVFRDGELTFVRGLEQVLWRVDFKDGFAAELATSCYEEPNWAEFGGEVVAALETLAEVGVSGAVEVLGGFLPLGLEAWKEFWGDWYYCASCIYHSGETADLSNLGCAIVKTLATECPGLDVRKDVRVVSERSQPLLASLHLAIVAATKHSKAVLVRHAKTESCLADLLLLHQAPHQVLITSIHAHFWWKAKDTIGVWIKTLSLLKCEELEINALRVLRNASFVSGFLAFKLGWSIHDCLWVVRELVSWLRLCQIVSLMFTPLAQITCHCQVLWPCIKNNLNRLRWLANIYRSHIQAILTTS